MLLYITVSQVYFTHKEIIVKLQKIVYLLAIGICIGTAMSVALHDVSVGVALGVAATAAFASPKSKSLDSE